MAETAIEWTDATWNPVTGCDREERDVDDVLRNFRLDPPGDF